MFGLGSIHGVAKNHGFSLRPPKDLIAPLELGTWHCPILSEPRPSSAPWHLRIGRARGRGRQVIHGRQHGGSLHARRRPRTGHRGLVGKEKGEGCELGWRSSATVMFGPKVLLNKSLPFRSVRSHIFRRGPLHLTDAFVGGCAPTAHPSQLKFHAANQG